MIICYVSRGVCGSLNEELDEALDGKQKEHLYTEYQFFDHINDIQNNLSEVQLNDKITTKDALMVMRKEKLNKDLEGIKIPRDDLFLPIEPKMTVCSLKPGSGKVLQSAAKIPIMVGFEVKYNEMAQKEQKENEGEQDQKVCIDSIV